VVEVETTGLYGNDRMVEVADGPSPARAPSSTHGTHLPTPSAMAKLLTALVLQSGASCPAHIDELETDACPRTLRREHVSGESVEIPYLARTAMAAHQRGQTGGKLLYLDMLG
jgi:hypothetical protein